MRSKSSDTAMITWALVPLYFAAFHVSSVVNWTKWMHVHAHHTYLKYNWNYSFYSADDEKQSRNFDLNCCLVQLRWSGLSLCYCTSHSFSIGSLRIVSGIGVMNENYEDFSFGRLNWYAEIDWNLLCSYELGRFVAPVYDQSIVWIQIAYASWSCTIAVTALHIEHTSQQSES